MSNSFEDITVTGLDEKMSKVVENGNSSLYLSLSNHTDPAWNTAFDEAWNSVMHNQWRRARATGSHIHIECHHSELHSVHMPYINDAVDKANQKYKLVLQQRHTQSQVKKEQEQRRNDLTQNLKDGFKKNT